MADWVPLLFFLPAWLAAAVLLWQLWESYRRDKKWAPKPPKETSWDRFRQAVLEGTGRSSVAGNPYVQHENGWLFFKGFKTRIKK